MADQQPPADSAEKTAPWPWRSLQDPPQMADVTQDHLDRIRDLVVVWNEAESGAAGLAHPDWEDIEDRPDDAFILALEVFLDAARPAEFKGRIRNPYAHPDAQRYMLDAVPAREVAELLLAGKDIDYCAEADEITLWRSADLRAYGINPKRPFGSESVSRDVRELIDPERALSNAAFGKRRKWLESRLLLLLQFFVQNAELAPGHWRRGPDARWRQADPAAPVPAEDLTACEWRNRMFLHHHYGNEAYAQTLHALVHLIRNHRLAGSYVELEQQFRLGDHIDIENKRDYEGSAEEHLRAALRHFPETPDDPEPWFTLNLARLLNMQSRFDEARAVLEQAGLWDIPAAKADFRAMNAMAPAWAEGLIARTNLGLISMDEFLEMLFGEHRDWRGRERPWDFVWNIHYDPARGRAANDWLGHGYLQGLAAQLEIMRGP